MIDWLLAPALAAVQTTSAPTVTPHVEPIEVVEVGCGALEADEIARLLALELDDVVPQMRSGPPLRIELTCEAPLLAIAIVDPITDKRMARDVPLPLEEPGRERVIALAIAQLFEASWLELLLPTPPPEQTVTREPAPPPAAIEAARSSAAAVVRRPSRSLALLVAGTIHGRALERAPTLAGGGELDVRPWFGAAALVVRLGFDAAQFRRDLGTIRGWLLTLGLGVAGRVRISPRWHLAGAAVISGGLGRLRGVASRPDVPTGAITAPTGQLAVDLGPQLRLGTTVLALEAEIGGTLRAPEGLVTDGEPVSLGGLWAGAALRVGFEWSPARRRP